MNMFFTVFAQVHRVTLDLTPFTSSQDGQISFRTPVGFNSILQNIKTFLTISSTIFLFITTGPIQLSVYIWMHFTGIGSTGGVQKLPPQKKNYGGGGSVIPLPQKGKKAK